MDIKRQIQYNGCDEPLAFLDAEAERLKAYAELHRTASLEEFFRRLETGDAKLTDPVGILREYGSYESYEAALLSARNQDDHMLEMAECFSKMPLKTMLSVMYDVRCDKPVSEETVRGICDKAMAAYGVTLADDYVVYLRTCGRLAVCGVEMSGFYPFGEYDILANIGEARAEIGISDKYYPLCWFESEDTATVAYFQDASGIVYALDCDLTLEPEFRSLQEFLAACWLRLKWDDEIRISCAAWAI